MSTSAPPMPAVRAALTGLIDYAGLFPPAQLDMRAAAAEYAELRRNPHAWMLGRFIVPLSRLAELGAAIPPGAPAFRSSGIFDGEPGHGGSWFVAEDENTRIETFEIRTEPEKIRRLAERVRASGLERYPIYIEWPRNNRWLSSLDGTMTLLRENGLGAKIRCGGLEASAFPAPSDVAAFVHAAARHGVAFKATAGLHHPVRYVDPPSGFHMHGFLNLLFSAVFAFAGAQAAEIETILSDEDPLRFEFNDSGIQYGDSTAPTSAIEKVRREFFTSYGSCSFDEPVADLHKLGLI